MSQSEQMKHIRPANKGQAKKSYVKPDFRHEKVFETMALRCGKVQGTQGQCNHNRSAS
jgi:hypothetical protein